MNNLNSTNNLNIFFTKEKKYLNQYYQLREKCFHEDNGWLKYDGSESEFDNKSHIAIATQDDEVIGGIRIMFGNECNAFSSETPNTKYVYRKYLVLKNETVLPNLIAEISSLVVNRLYRNSLVSIGLADFVYKFAESRNIKHIFIIANQFHCRIYRIMIKKINPNAIIDKFYPWKREEKFSNTKTFMIYVKIP
jgi:hypothetical protein